MLLSGTTLVLNYPLPFLNHFLSLTGPIKLGSSNKGERQQRKEHWIPVFCSRPLCNRRRRGWKNNRGRLPRQQSPPLPRMEAQWEKMERLKDDKWRRGTEGGVIAVTHVVSSGGSGVSSNDSWFHSEGRHAARRSGLHLWIFMLWVHTDFSPHFFAVFHGGVGCGGRRAGGWKGVVLALADPCAPRTHFWRYWHVNLQGNKSLLKW